MKKTLLLFLAVTITATYAADTQEMSKGKALNALLFATWDTDRIIKLERSKDFKTFSGALQALTPETRRKEMENPLIKKIIIARTAVLEKEQNEKDKIKNLRKINFKTIQELEELKSASSKRGRRGSATPSPTSKQPSSKFKTK